MDGSGARTLVLGAVLCLGGLELGSRVLGLATPLPEEYSHFAPHSVLPWNLQPNLDRTAGSRTGEFEIRIRTNALGFRGPDRELEKPPGTWRIVGIGDSFTWGSGAQEEATFLARVEAALAARGGPAVEAINLGIPRYWPEPEALVLRHYGLHYQPDLVLVGVLPNDFEDTRIGDTLSIGHGYILSSRARGLGGVGYWLYRHSHVARLALAHRLTAAWDRDRRGTGVEEEDAETVWARMYEAWGRMVDMTRAADARIAFVHIPLGPPWSVEAHEFPDRLRRFCAARECAVIDVLPAFSAHPTPDELYYPIDGHCTETGYALIADVIVRELESRGIWPEGLLPRARDKSAGARIGEPTVSR